MGVSTIKFLIFSALLIFSFSPVFAVTGGPVAWWKFDEVTGIYAYDSSPNDIDGTLYSVSRITGKIEGALSFDGTDDYVLIPHNSSLEPTSEITISAWVNLASGSLGNTMDIYRKEDGGDSGRKVLRFVDSSNCDNPGTYGCIEFGLNIGETYRKLQVAISNAADWENGWHHVAATYDGSNMKIYYDLYQPQCDGSTCPPFSAVYSLSVIGSIGTGTTSAYIGSKDGSSEFLNGKIDDVRIFSRALSLYEVLALHQAGDGHAAGSGPVLWWKFDEGNGFTASDSSGYGSTGTLTSSGGSPNWVSGKIGSNALSFNGGHVQLASRYTNEYGVLNPNLRLDQFTLSTWAYFNSLSSVDPGYPTAGQALIGKFLNYFFWWDVGSSTMRVLFYDGQAFRGTGPGYDGGASWVPIIHQWYHIVGTYDGYKLRLYVNGLLISESNYIGTIPEITTEYFCSPWFHPTGYSCDNCFAAGKWVDEGYGNPDARNFNGILDDVRIYNYALSTDEVRDIYSEGEQLKAWWELDEGTGTSAGDSSVNDNEGTLYNNPTWVSGKIGSNALSFDGVNDYVSVPDSASLDISSKITTSFWMKPATLYDNTAGTNMGLLDKGGAYQIFLDKSDGKLKFSLGDSTTDSWSTSSGSIGSIYSLAVYNGKLYAGTSWGQVYYYDGSSWQVSQGAPSLGVYSMAVYNGKLYAGTSSGHVWSYDSTWTDLGQIGSLTQIDTLSVYGNKLYAGGNYFSGGSWTGKIYSYDGSWTLVGTLSYVYSLTVYNGKLYAGTSSQVYRYDEGTTWTYIAGPYSAFLTVYGSKLYAASAAGQEVYSYDGSSWTSTGSGSPYVTYSLAVYNGKLYAGTQTGHIYIYDGSSWTEDTNSPSNVRSLAVYNGKLYAGTFWSPVYVYGNNQVLASTKNSWNAGWHYIVAIYDCTTMKIYVDGMLDNSKTISFTIDTTNFALLIGKTYGSQMVGGTPEAFDGVIDDIHIYNRALSADEIKYTFSEVNKLVAWWELDEGTGTSAGDSSVNDNEGTLYNNPTWVSGKIGSNALSFDGTDDYMDVADSPSLDSSSEITLSTWLKLDASFPGTAETNMGLLDKDAYQLYLDKSSGKLKFHLSSSWLLDSNSPSAVFATAVYDGKLYAGGNYFSGGSWTGKIYSYDGSWTLVGTLTYIHSLAVYNGNLYAGTNSQVYRYDGGTTWTYIAGPYSAYLAVYNGNLYAAGSAGDEVYSYDGSSWTSTGSGSPYITYSLAVYNGKLYAGGNIGVYYYDGSWHNPISGSPSNVFSLAVYNNKLYAGTYGQVYVYDVSWSISSGSPEGVYALAVDDVNGKLYAGTGAGVRSVYIYDGTWRNTGLNKSANIFELIFYNDKLYAGSDALQIYTYDNTGFLASTKNSWDTNWHHIAATYDGSAMKTYVDGVLDNSKSTSLTVSTNNLALLVGKTYGLHMFDGVLDDVRVYNRALLSDEVCNLCKAGELSCEC